MTRNVTRAAAALALVLGSAVGLAAPASASPSGLILCPTHSRLLFPDVHGAWADVQQRGRLLDVFVLNSTSAQDYYIDGRYERFVSDGKNVYRFCYDRRPERPEGSRDRFREPSNPGSGGGGVSLGAGSWLVGSRNIPVGVVNVGPVEDLR